MARVLSDNWQLARAIRLQALRTDPSCFGSSVDIAVLMTGADWRDELVRNVWLVASHTSAPTPIGLAVLYADDIYPDGAPQLGAMWVEPGWRRNGIARALEVCIDAEARQAGAAKMGLWVTSDNARAAEVYGRFGYVFTGATKAAPRDHTVAMRRMLRTIHSAR